MIAGSETPQKEQIHTPGSEVLHTSTSTSKPPSTFTMTCEAQQVVQSVSETLNHLLSSRTSLSKSPPVQPTSSEAGQFFPFLKLPRELRDKIYRSILVWSRPLKSMHPPKQKGVEVEAKEAKDKKTSIEDEEKNVERQTQIFEAEFGPATKEGILWVNKQIRDEAQDAFFKENKFFYDEDVIRDDPSPNGQRRINRPMHKFEYRVKFPDTYKQARTIHATFSLSTNTLISEFVQLLLQNPNLRTLSVHFANLNIPMMKEARREVRKLLRLKAVEDISLTMSIDSDYRWLDVNGTRRERALMDLLDQIEKRVLAKRLD
ncbi:hypothetical protein Vi05172_g7226 [Venturia inaequalis]|nr:hypothetical protein Vi05172_g7226 [Venturia inaequalis]